MSRFYVPRENIKGDRITVSGEEAHHMIDVMRIREGDEVVVFDGTGREYSGLVSRVEARLKEAEIKVMGISEDHQEPAITVTLAQAIPKKDKMDYLVQKATELGVSEIIPVVTERTVVRPAKASSSRKTDRWRKICLGAAKQCGRCDVPEVRDIVGFDPLTELFTSFDNVFFACLGQGAAPLKKALDRPLSGKVMLVIGPEGGFSPAEISRAGKAGCDLVSLGRRVLKSDTAGLYVLSVMNYQFSI
ncbi:MAG: 16S rRNA (uracil(1498)-N(3))-methyltransferase [Candidatus Omnitrophica bacterium]|nr:16S rRNA (uracil(1498)-N(3))-methyltransferase [Candidatus Omnitrophota bacterium]